MSTKTLAVTLLVSLIAACDGGGHGIRSKHPPVSVEQTLPARGDVPEVIMAAEAAERVWRIRPTPEAAWNRARAREALHLSGQALIAWNDYLTLDPESPRIPEVLESVRRLTAITQSRRWNEARRRLLEANEFDRELRQETRTFGEEQVLASWADATLRGDEASAQRSLDLARTIGDELTRSGEPLLSESIAAITSAGKDSLRRLAAAHARYASGRRRFGGQEMRAAATELTEAARALGDTSSPFALRAELYAATAQYYGAQLDRAETSLRALAQKSRHPTVAAQAHWVLGLIEYSRGHNNEALDAYRNALAAFERLEEVENTAAIETLLAETYRALGRPAEAWRYQERALRSMQRLGATRRSHAILTGAARAASDWNAPHTALLFQSALLSLARVSGDAVSIADALIGHAAYAAAAGDRSTALADLEETGWQAAAIRDASMRDRTRANLLAATVMVWRGSDDRRAAAVAIEAVKAMIRVGNRARLVRLRLETGRALRAAGDSTRALHEWQEGIGECERQRAALSAVEYRRTYFEQCRALFDEAVGALAASHRFDEARAVADRNRARALRDGLAAGNAPRANVPADLMIVELSVLPEQTVAWVSDRSGVSSAILPIGRAALTRAVDELVAARSDERAFRTASARLFDVLLRPVAPQLAARIVFVPDLDAYRIPFAALFDARRGRYLVEEHEVMVAPSASLLGRRADRRPDSSSRPLLIDTSSGALRGAAREIARLAELYPEAKVMRGGYMGDDVIRSLHSADLIHIAGHAIRETKLADPALVLATGLIYPQEIAALRLDDSSLVILSACSTARGQIGSDGPLSIARAFLAAGSEQVVATLWDVEDDATTPLMTRFHQLLRETADPRHSLHALQHEAIRQSVPVRHWAALEILQTQL